MAKTYVVTALCALVNVQGGFAQLMQRGAVLPDNVDPDQLQHMLDNDIVAEGVLVGGLEPVLTGDLTEEVTTLGDGTEGDGDSDEAPAKSASRADWDAYAKSQGLMDEEVAAFSSKEELQKHFGVE